MLQKGVTANTNVERDKTTHVNIKAKRRPYLEILKKYNVNKSHSNLPNTSRNMKNIYVRTVRYDWCKNNIQ